MSRDPWKFTLCDLFHIDTNHVLEVIQNSEETKRKAFFGDTILKAFIGEYFWGKYQLQLTCQELSELRIHYESNIILATFLLKGTDFTNYFAEQRSPHWYGTIVEALIWDSYSSKKLLERAAELDRVVRNIIGWIDECVRFDVLKPILIWTEKEQIVWVSANPSLRFDPLNEANLRDDNWSAAEENSQLTSRKSTSVPGPKGPSSSLESNLSRGTVAVKSEAQTQTKGISSPTVPYYGHSSFQLSSFRLLQEICEKIVIKPSSFRAETSLVSNLKQQQPQQPTPSKTTTTVVVQRSVTSDTESIASVNSGHFHAYNENALLSAMKRFEEHRWGEYGSQHDDLSQQRPACSWYGSRCLDCDAFLVCRKISNKYSDFFRLGFKNCPQKSYKYWIDEFRPHVQHLYHSQKLGLISENELISWGYLLNNNPTTAEILRPNHATIFRIPGPESQHVFGVNDSQHTRIDDQHTPSSWYGTKCQRCKALRVNRKISNRYSKDFILCFENCPGEMNYLIWLMAYRPHLRKQLEEGELGKITEEELISWGYL